ncbi:MAG TPA: hypothetical protein PLR07_12990, partial [Promineifilum sp.]|nr:hypothetical protein [Promineifilum sp.]
THRPTRWQIATSSAGEALLVLAENAYPGWEVRIDGQRAEPLTAYTSIRAVCVPAGEHTVEWVFRPWLYGAGAVITLVALALVIFAAIRLRRPESSVR